MAIFKLIENTNPILAIPLSGCSEDMNRQEMKDQFIENGAIHVTKYTSLMKSGARLSGKIGIYLMPSKISFEIDDYLDLSLAKLILEKKI